MKANKSFLFVLIIFLVLSIKLPDVNAYSAGSGGSQAYEYTWGVCYWLSNDSSGYNPNGTGWRSWSSSPYAPNSRYDQWASANSMGAWERYNIDWSTASNKPSDWGSYPIDGIDGVEYGDFYAYSGGPVNHYRRRFILWYRRPTPSVVDNQITGADYVNGSDYWVKNGTQLTVKTQAYDLAGTIDTSYLRVVSSSYDARRYLQANNNSVEFQTASGITVTSGNLGYNTNGYRESVWGVKPLADNQNFDTQVYYYNQTVGYGQWNNYVSTGYRIRTDFTAPSVPTINPSRTGWGTNNVTFTVTGGTDSGSGVARSEYQLDGGAWTTYSGTVTVSTTGSHTVNARTIDNVGNISSTATTSFGIDAVAPTGSIVINQNGITHTDNTQADFQQGTQSNTTATSAGNEEITSYLTDDFQSGNLNNWTSTSGWSVITSGASKYAQASGAPYTLSKTFPSAQSSGYFKEAVNFTETNQYHYPLYPATGTGNSFYAISAKPDGHFGYYDGTSYKNFPTDKTYAANTWYTLELYWYSNSTYKVIIDGTDLTNGGIAAKDNTGSLITSLNTLRILNTDSVGTGGMRVDDIVVRTQTSGTYTSSIIDISSPDAVRNSTIDWTASTPSGTSITVQTNVSLDNGTTWGGWQNATDSSSIPGITSTTNITNARLQYKVQFNTTILGNMPQLQSVIFNITIQDTITNNPTVTLTISAADTISGLDKMMISNDSGFLGAVWENYATSKSWPLSSGDGTKTVYIKFKDLAGNVSTAYSDTIIVDATAPTITLSQSPTTATTGNVTITATISDNVGGSGIAAKEWASGNQAASYFATGGTTLTGTTFTVSANGTYTVYAKDNVGNEAVGTITVSNIDKTAPTITLSQSPTVPTTGNVTITATISDNAGGSGIAAKEWAPGNQAASYFATGGTTLTGTTFTVSANGTYTVYAKDNAGNEVVNTIIVSNIDKTAPTITLSQSPTAPTTGNVTITATVSDNAGGSGIAAKEWASGNKAASYFATGGTTLAGTTFTVSANGTYTVYAKDNAGNETVNTIAVSNIYILPTLNTPAITNGKIYLGQDLTLAATGTNISATPSQSAYRIYYATTLTAPPINNSTVPPDPSWVDSGIAGAMNVNSSTSVSQIIAGLSGTDWTFVTFKVWVASSTGDSVFKYSQAYPVNNDQSSITDGSAIIGYSGHNQLIRISGSTKDLVLSDPTTTVDQYGPYSSSDLAALPSNNTFSNGKTVKYRLEFDVLNSANVQDLRVVFDFNQLNEKKLELAPTSMKLEKLQAGSFVVIKDLSTVFVKQSRNRYSVKLGNDLGGTPMIIANGNARYAIEYTCSLNVSAVKSSANPIIRNNAQISTYLTSGAYPSIVESERPGRKVNITTQIARPAM